MSAHPHLHVVGDGIYVAVPCLIAHGKGQIKVVRQKTALYNIFTCTELAVVVGHASPLTPYFWAVNFGSLLPYLSTHT
jgi:hypothetical protein